MAKESSIQVATYARDLRFLLRLSSGSPPPVPARFVPGGSIEERLARFTTRRACGHLRRYIFPAGSPAPAAPAGARIVRVRPQLYARALLGASAFPHLVFLQVLAIPGLTPSQRTVIDEAMADALWRSYRGFLLPTPLLEALRLANEDSSDALGLLRFELMRRDFADPDVLPAHAAERRIHTRASLLVSAGRRALSDPALAVAELFADVAYLQRISLEELIRAERTRRPGQTRAQRLEEMEANDGFEDALPAILQTEPIRAAIAQVPIKGNLEGVAAFTSNRLQIDRTGVLEGIGTLEEPRTAPRRMLSGPAPAADEEARRPPPRPVPPSLPDPPRLEPRPLPWTGAEPALAVPEWEPLGLSRISPEVLSRHVLAVGGTGSGKTVSCVVPLAAAALRYPGPGGPEELRPALLVIDPKHEITPALEAMTREQALDRRVVRGETRMLDLFEAEAPHALSPEQIVERVFGVSRAWQREGGDRQQPFFIQAAQRVLQELVAIDGSLYRAGGAPHIDAFWDAVGQRLQEEGVSPSHVFEPSSYWPRLLQFTSLTAVSRRPVSLYLKTCEQFGVPTGQTVPVRAWEGIPGDTWGCIIATLQNAAREVADADRMVWLHPYQRPPEERKLSVLDALEAGWCVAYQPRPSSATDLYLLRLVKSSWYRLSLVRPNKVRPLVIVIDEFQRIVSADASSEATLLDTCRAHRVAVVAATISISALQLALADSQVGGRGTALDAMLDAIGTRLFFRTTDTHSQIMLQTLLPAPPPGRPHVAAVRPLSSLDVGEAVVMSALGGWTRRRIRLSTPP
jgi:hypothetical protein